MGGFVIYDDMEEFRNKTEKILQKMMKKMEMKSSIESYGQYEGKMKESIEKNKDPKIYLLDIEGANGESGIDIAKKIRKTDWNSVIILVTSHVEMGYEALKAKIMLLDFICKFNNWEENLVRTVQEAIKKLGENNLLVLESGNITYRIYASDVLYVLKDSVDRKCVIKTVDHEIPVNKTMSEVSELLDERFYLTHRSCYVNLDKITGIDWKKNMIYFEQGEEIDYLARDRKKGLKEYVGSC